MEISTQQPQKPAHQGQFQCSTCQRTFSRVDHLTRHVRSHLQDRPFQCQTCNKAFGRPDLLKRHAAGHDDQNGGKRLKRQHNTAPRVSQACRPCVTAKLKCDDKKPCSRCLQRGIACKQEDRESKERETQSDNPMPCRDSPTNTGPNISVVAMDTHLQITKPTTPLPVTHDQASFEPELQDPSPFGFPEYDMSCFVRGVISSPVANTHRATPAEEWPYRDFSGGPRGLLDFTVDSNFDFEDADFSLLDQPSGNAYGIISNGYQQPTVKQGSDTTEFKDPRRHVALGTEAYRQSSLGFWEPSRHDRSASELENLSVLGPDEGASEPHFSLDEHCLGESLHRSTRDEIMAMILDTCKTEKKRSVIKAFPTRRLLDSLLQNFFHYHNQQIDSYVHGPTFRPNQQEPELLGAVVATGAVLTCTRTLHTLGFAMQETVRRTLPERFNEANVLSRALWALQSFMCEIEIGIWSGIKRKMEIAESHPQILYTMLRRARQFRAHNTAPSSSAPLPEDVGENLHRKWLRWVEQESCRRLVHHAFIMDAQSSMAMLTSPIISFAELSTSFPEARDLWLAEDAEKWKAVYLSRPRPHAPVSLVDYLREPIEIPDHYDVHFAHLVILHGIWGMIWQHSQLQATLNRAKYSHAAVALQHQEIIQKLQRFQINIVDCPEPPRPETTLVLELLHMHLHLSFESIELFAGKGDLEDARQVFPSLQQWFDSSESRQAIWHGGQVIRAARTFRPNHLRGFYAIAVYQASLAIWAYSMICLAKGMREEGPAQAQTTMPEAVCLDGPDSPAVQRFITLGKGIPSWSQPHRASGKPALPVPLSDQETIMNAILEALDGNFPRHLEREAPPPLVENLTQLLRELGRAAAGVKA